MSWPRTHTHGLTTGLPTHLHRLLVALQPPLPLLLSVAVLEFDSAGVYVDGREVDLHGSQRAVAA